MDRQGRDWSLETATDIPLAEPTRRTTAQKARHGSATRVCFIFSEIFLLKIRLCSPIEETIVVDGPSTFEMAKRSKSVTGRKTANEKPKRKRKSTPKPINPDLPPKKPTQRRKRSIHGKITVSEKDKINVDRSSETEEEAEE